MILNGIDVNILTSIELVDAYNKKFPIGFTNDFVIYCVHNKINGKNYIGQTVNFRNRYSDSYIGHFRDYDRYLKRSLVGERILYAAWEKYGLESFIVYIIDTGKDRKELNDREIFWIKELHTCTKDPECHGYNLTWGGEDINLASEESIKKSLATRLERFGNYVSPKCHTPEAFAKGNKTKEERYGHGGFINAFTPEANKKRQQTNLRLYGTTHGPRISREAIDKMVKRKIEMFGDPMGICNTPENREKANRNRAVTQMFTSIYNNISRSNSEPLCFKDYQSLVFRRYKRSKDAERHLSRLSELIPLLVNDDRWTDKLNKIFLDLVNRIGK